MPTDLHIHIEALVSRGELSWEHLSAPDMPRRQTLFEHLGLRNPENRVPCSGNTLRFGIPRDATALTKILFAHDEGHSAHWLTLAQCGGLENWCETNGLYTPRRDSAPPFGWIFGYHFKDYAMQPELLPTGILDLRAIYWFDS